MHFPMWFPLPKALRQRKKEHVDKCKHSDDKGNEGTQAGNPRECSVPVPGASSPGKVSWDCLPTLRLRGAENSGLRRL